MNMIYLCIIIGIVSFINIEGTEKNRLGITTTKDGKTWINFWKVKVGLDSILFPAIIFATIGLILSATYGFYIGSVLGTLAWITFMIGTSASISILIKEYTDDFAFVKIMAVIILCIFMALVIIRPYTGSVGDNKVYSDLEDTEKNTAEPDVYLTGAKDTRVISWTLATEYLERAYGDSASVLTTSSNVLSLNTDPDYVNGKFVWINAPRYEHFKWFGKEIPFYVYVKNDVNNISKDGYNPVHRSEDSFSVHRSQISWGNRIEHVLDDRYAGKYVTVQIRINLDDNYNAYWVVYLGKRETTRNVIDLKKILIINASDIHDLKEYSVDDPNIPGWLDVIYPDSYIEEWANLWGKWRNGIWYKWFNKKHLVTSDDSPRFIILNNTSYWYLPMRQLDSNVLGGYILMNTRTGKTTYYNREDESLANGDTAKEQIDKYLASGIVGFKQLQIHEGYLYPIKMNSGNIREAYIFPLYSGFTIQQYAIIDAKQYTQTPSLHQNLEIVLDKYKSTVFEESTNSNESEMLWENMTFRTAYAENEEGAFISNNTTFIISKESLEVGLIINPDDEWREYKLAVADYENGKNVTVSCTHRNNEVYDIDYNKSNLVGR